MQRAHIVETEPFSETFGPKAQRKRPRIEAGSFEELGKVGAAAADEAENVADETGAAVIGTVTHFHNYHPLTYLTQNLWLHQWLSHKRMPIISSPFTPRARLDVSMESFTKLSILQTLFCMFLTLGIHWVPFANRCWSISKRKKRTNRLS